LIYDLLKEGEIFEIKTGRVKLIQWVHMKN
jgi:hypothetical protein